MRYAGLDDGMRPAASSRGQGTGMGGVGAANPGH